jgi:serine/threonine protein kinase
MEETEDADVQGRFAIDLCHAEEFCHADASSCDLREPIPQLREILAIIENVCKTCSTLWVNKQQCKQMADSFSAVGAVLKGLRWNRNYFVRREDSDGGQDKKYPELDKLLPVLRKGESLVSYYNSWNGSVFGLIDNREAMFKEVHEELEIMKEQFLSEGLVASTRKSEKPKEMDVMNLDVIRQVVEGMDKAHNLVVEDSQEGGLVIEKADSVEEMVTDIWLVEKITGKDMDKMKGLDITRQVKRAQDLIGERIYLGEVCKVTWKGVPYSVKVFGVVNFGVFDMALQAGKGMVYLHPNGVFHTDLESLNILGNKHLMESLKLVELDSTICKGANIEDACSWGIPCTARALPGSMWKATESRILHDEQQEKFLKHLCGEEWRENGDANSYLQEEPLLNVDLDLDHSGKAFGASASVKVAWSRREATESCETASRFAEDDEALPTDSSSKNVALGSCAPEAQKIQQDSIEIVSGCQAVNDGEPARKRNRNRTWSDDEKLALLELTEEAPRLDAGPDWDYVSDTLLEEDGFDRASISCQMQWGTLLQSYRATQDHESNSTSEFDLECREIIDSLLAANPLEEETRIFPMDADLPSSASSLCGFQPSAIYMDHFNCDEVLDDESTDDESEEIDVQSEDEGVSVDSTATLESRAEATADNHDETSSELYMRDGLQIETNTSRKGSGEDDVIARISPFVNKQVEDALKPLISVFQRREETEQKHRAELLAIEEEKLRLKREKMQLRRHAALANSN